MFLKALIRQDNYEERLSHLMMQLVLYKDNQSIFKKNWAIPELKHLYWARCELRGPFLALYLKINKVEKGAIRSFKSVTVSQKQSGKVLFEIKDIQAEIFGIGAKGVRIEDELCIIRRVKQIAEDYVAISGVYTVSVRQP